MTLPSHSLVAFNTATASANKIHDDDVARRFGFTGGLVPGVDVYAYLTRPPAQAWGLAWLKSGTMQGRFGTPVYDGDRVTVSEGEEPGSLALTDPRGTVCATGAASLPADPPANVDPASWPNVAQRTDPPPASAATLAVGTAFGLEPHGFHADRHGEYLADVRDDLALYVELGVAHPGWLLRDANYVLARNVVLGPWIHVESAVQHLAPVADGTEVGCRAIVTNEWEHKGHRFVTLDVLHTADGAPVARTTHTAIHRPRQVAEG